ncbi:MAG: hypothetical protein WCC47_24920 [Pseudonocardiaceae bacterium]
MDNDTYPKRYGTFGEFSTQEEADAKSLQEWREIFGDPLPPDHPRVRLGDSAFHKPGRRRVRRERGARKTIASEGLDITNLAPEEVVALYRLTDNEVVSTEAGAAWAQDSLGLHARLHCTLENISAINSVVAQESARAIFTAFADSPLAEDRIQLASNFIVPFTMYHDPDHGLVLWDQLMRDPDQQVRDVAEQQLTQVLGDTRHDRRRRPAVGMHAVERVNEDRLDRYGLTHDTAYQLMESYAYAENGQYQHDLGRAALSKVVVPG